MKDITITQKDRKELLRLINIMSRGLGNARNLFDLELSDLRNLDELQWTLFHALELAQNGADCGFNAEPFILKEEKLKEEKKNED
jgi:hypothetical protein